MNEKKSENSVLKLLVEVVLCLIIAIILVGVIQQFFLAPVAVSGESMLPTLHASGDKVFVQKRFYKIERDCIVVFYKPNGNDVTSKNPANSISFSDFFNSLPFINKIPVLTEEEDSAAGDYKCLIKRVIGIPGDVIEIKYSEDGKDAMLYRNGELIDDYASTMMLPKGIAAKGGVREGTWTVGEGELFVLGDNRNISYDCEDEDFVKGLTDSGCIKQEWLMGRVILARVGGDYKFDKKIIPDKVGF